MKNKKIEHVNRLDVFLQGKLVGTLAMGAGGTIHFAYATDWAHKGVALSPFPPFQRDRDGFPLSSAAFKAKNNNYDGLHGVFNDALPDGWGLLLMDRAFGENPGWARHEITPLDRLAYIGNRAMGALEFRPALEQQAFNEPSLSDLAEAALSVQEGTPGDVAHSLMVQGGSPGGARPKVTLAVNVDWTHCLSGFESIPENYEHWIVKFRAKDHDPECVGRIEKAYSEMAGLAGLAMPKTQLVTMDVRGKAMDHFAVKRFDREWNEKKHVLTLGGMLDADHRLPSLSYGVLLDAVFIVTRDIREVEKAFRMMLFNMLAHNKDDHVKNFAFILEDSGWVLSPAYDLTFSAGMRNQHMTYLEGGGGMEAVAALAEKHGLDRWNEILREVRDAVEHWPKIAKKLGVTHSIIKEYGDAIMNVPLRKTMELDKSDATTRQRKNGKGKGMDGGSL